MPARESNEEIVMTVQQLSEYDGKDGSKAYIAIDGTIYDVTKVAQWAGGMHRNFTAGKDYSSEMKNAPHGLAKLIGIPVVGKLEE